MRMQRIRRLTRRLRSSLRRAPWFSGTVARHGPRNPFRSPRAEWRRERSAKRAKLSRPASRRKASRPHPPSWRPRWRPIPPPALARQVCVDAGLVPPDGVRNLGPGKIIRKYATTALRSLRPPPPCASDAALDARHLHTRAVWAAAYRCQSFAPLQAAFDALTNDQRISMTVERLLRLRPRV